MYETHVTIEPVLNENSMAILKEIAKQHGFKVAELLMVKEDGKTMQSKLDSFLTGHDKTYPGAHESMISLVHALKAGKFKVWRYKIECIILDSKYQNDPECLL